LARGAVVSLGRGEASICRVNATYSCHNHGGGRRRPPSTTDAAPGAVKQGPTESHPRLARQVSLSSIPTSQYSAYG